MTEALLSKTSSQFVANVKNTKTTYQGSTFNVVSKVCSGSRSANQGWGNNVSLHKGWLGVSANGGFNPVVDLVQYDGTNWNTIKEINSISSTLTFGTQLLIRGDGDLTNEVSGATMGTTTGVSISSTKHAYYASSIKFDGTTGNRINAHGVNLSGTEFTIDFWIYPEIKANNWDSSGSTLTNVYELISSRPVGTSVDAFAIEVTTPVTETGTATLSVYLSSNKSTWDISSNSVPTSLQLYQWSYVRIKRTKINYLNDELSVWVNGFQKTSVLIGATSIVASGSNTYIGSTGDGKYSYQGYLSDIRIVTNNSIDGTILPGRSDILGKGYFTGLGQNVSVIDEHNVIVGLPALKEGTITQQIISGSGSTMHYTTDNTGAWQQGYITSASGLSNGRFTNDQFGYSIAFDSYGRLVVGSPGNGSFLNNCFYEAQDLGGAYVFLYDKWTQRIIYQQKIVCSSRPTNSSNLVRFGEIIYSKGTDLVFGMPDFNFTYDVTTDNYGSPLQHTRVARSEESRIEYYYSTGVSSSYTLSSFNNFGLLTLNQTTAYNTPINLPANFNSTRVRVGDNIALMDANFYVFSQPNSSIATRAPNGTWPSIVCGTVNPWTRPTSFGTSGTVTDSGVNFSFPGSNIFRSVNDQFGASVWSDGTGSVLIGSPGHRYDATYDTSVLEAGAIYHYLYDPSTIRGFRFLNQKIIEPTRGLKHRIGEKLSVGTYRMVTTKKNPNKIQYWTYTPSTKVWTYDSETVDTANNTLAYYDINNKVWYNRTASTGNLADSTITASPTMITNTYKFGTTSAYFDGNACLDLYSNAQLGDFSFGSTAFSIEFWVNHSTLPTTINYFEFGNYNNNLGLLFQYSSGSFNLYANGVSYGIGAPGFATNTWYHIAVTRNSSNIVKIFVNGTQVGSNPTIAANITLTNSGSPRSCRFGCGYYSTSYGLTGYMDHIRVYNGITPYTANFTPPTSAPTNANNPVCLINMDNAVTVSAKPTFAKAIALVDDNTLWSSHTGADLGDYGTTPVSLTSYTSTFYPYGQNTYNINAAGEMLDPNGSNTSYAITEAANNATHYAVWNSVATLTNVRTTYSMYIKKIGSSTRRMTLWVTGSSDNYATNIAQVTVDADGNFVQGIGSNYISYSTTSAGNGYTKLSMTLNSGSNTNFYFCYEFGTSGGSYSYTGDGTSGFYIWKPEVSFDQCYNIEGIGYYGGTTGFSVTFNNQLAPDNTYTAGTFTETSANVTRYNNTQWSLNFYGVTYSYSVFAKPVSGSRYFHLAIGPYNGGTPTNGAIFDTSGNVVDTYNCGAKSEPYPNGYFRFSISFNPTGGNVTLQTYFTFLNSTQQFNSTYTGDGTSTWYVWRPQFEYRAFPSKSVYSPSGYITPDSFNLWDSDDYSSFAQQNVGKVSLYTRSGSAWYLSNTSLTNSSLGRYNVRFTGDKFGSSVSLYNNILAIGAPGHSFDDTGNAKYNELGGVFLYQYSNNQWNLANKVNLEAGNIGIKNTTVYNSASGPGFKYGADYLKLRSDTLIMTSSIRNPTLPVPAGYTTSNCTPINGSQIWVYSDVNSLSIRKRLINSAHKQVIKANSTVYVQSRPTDQTSGTVQSGAFSSLFRYTNSFIEPYINTNVTDIFTPVITNGVINFSTVNYTFNGGYARGVGDKFGYAIGFIGDNVLVGTPGRSRDKNGTAMTVVGNVASLWFDSTTSVYRYQTTLDIPLNSTSNTTNIVGDFIETTANRAYISATSYPIRYINYVGSGFGGTWNLTEVYPGNGGAGNWRNTSIAVLDQSLVALGRDYIIYGYPEVNCIDNATKQGTFVSVDLYGNPCTIGAGTGATNMTGSKWNYTIPAHSNGRLEYGLVDNSLLASAGRQSGSNFAISLSWLDNHVALIGTPFSTRNNSGVEMGATYGNAYIYWWDSNDHIFRYVTSYDQTANYNIGRMISCKGPNSAAIMGGASPTIVQTVSVSNNGMGSSFLLRNNSTASSTITSIAMVDNLSLIIGKAGDSAGNGSGVFDSRYASVGDWSAFLLNATSIRTPAYSNGRLAQNAINYSKFYINGRGSLDGFGTGMDFDGTTLSVTKISPNAQNTNNIFTYNWNSGLNTFQYQTQFTQTSRSNNIKVKGNDMFVSDARCSISGQTTTNGALSFYKKVGTGITATWNSVNTTTNTGSNGYGKAVSIVKPGVVAIGIPAYSTSAGNLAGQWGAYVFDNVGFTASFTGDNADIPLSKEYNRIANDQFGYSVVVWNDIIVVGSPGHSYKPDGTTNNTSAGAIHLYKNVGGNWIWDRKIISKNSVANMNWGYDIKIRNYKLIVSSIPTFNSNKGFVDLLTFNSDKIIYNKQFNGSTNQTMGRGIGWATDSEAILGTPTENGQNTSNTLVSNSGGWVSINSSGSDIWNMSSTVIMKVRDFYNNEVVGYCYGRDAQDMFGYTASLSGNYLAIGSPGRGRVSDGSSISSNSGTIWIYTWDSTRGKYWFNNQVQMGLLANVGYGKSIDFSGDYLIVGQPGRNSNNGGFQIFKKDGTNQDAWSRVDFVDQYDNTASQTSYDVAITSSGGLACATMPFSSGLDIAQFSVPVTESGAIVTRYLNSNVWNWASDTNSNILIQQPASFYYARNPGDAFGTNVALSGNQQWAVIGVPHHGYDNTYGTTATNNGAVFLHYGSAFPMINKVLPDTYIANRLFGSGLLLAGDRVLIKSNPTIALSEVWLRTTYNSWYNEIKLPGVGTNNLQMFMSDNQMLLGNDNTNTYDGAPFGVTGSGAVQMWTRDTNTWTKQYDFGMASVSNGRFSGDLFGTTVAVGNGWNVISAPYHDHIANSISTQTNIGSLNVFSLDNTSGSYVFEAKLNSDSTAQNVTTGNEYLRIYDTALLTSSNVSNIGQVWTRNGTANWTRGSSFTVPTRTKVDAVSSTGWVLTNTADGVEYSPQPTVTNAGSVTTFNVNNTTGSVTTVHRYVAAGRSNGRQAGDLFGSSLAIHPSWIAVGSTTHSFGDYGDARASGSGSIWIYALNTEGTYDFELKLVSTENNSNCIGILGNVKNNSLITFNSAYSQSSNKGYAEIWTRISTENWANSSVFKGSDVGFASSVTLMTDNLVSLGSPFANSTRSGLMSLVNAGEIRTFEKVSSWNEIGYWSSGGKTNVRNSGDLWGSSLALSRSLLAVGTPYHTYDHDGGSSLTNAGAIWLFARNQDNTFGLVDKFTANTRVSNALWANSLSLSKQNNMLAVGSPGENKAYVYTASSTNITLSTIAVAPDVATGDNFGWSVAIQKSSLLVGSPNSSYDLSGSSLMVGAGAAYVWYMDLDGVWHYKEKFIEDSGGGRVENSFFGKVVAMDYRNGAVIGASNYPTDKTGAHPLTDAGAVWAMFAG